MYTELDAHGVRNRPRISEILGIMFGGGYSAFQPFHFQSLNQLCRHLSECWGLHRLFRTRASPSRMGRKLQLLPRSTHIHADKILHLLTQLVILLSPFPTKASAQPITFCRKSQCVVLCRVSLLIHTQALFKPAFNNIYLVAFS